MPPTPSDSLFTGPEPIDVGDGLASWLESLGLEDQLGAAGLPTYDRDGSGALTWRDPATGEALSAERLTELDRLLRAVGEDPSHAVPVGLVRLRREGLARAALLEGGWLDYAAVGRLRGVSENAARFALHKAAERRAVLLVQHDVATLVPSFQLDAAGKVRDELLTVLEPLLAAGIDPWRTWIWLTSPAGLLGGAVPPRLLAIPRSCPSCSAPRSRSRSAPVRHTAEAAVTDAAGSARARRAPAAAARPAPTERPACRSDR